MQRYPAWKINILIFVATAAMVAAYSVWQVRRASKQFLENAREHARVVAAVVETSLADLSPEAPESVHLLERLNRLPGIANIHLQVRQSASPANAESTTRLILTEDRKVTETLIPLAAADLTVVLPAGHFSKRIAQMKSEFLLFAVVILTFGGFSTWWLYRSQQQRIVEAREFERRIARQHEEAALGRAAATIAHEIRNPLNAIGMGLQRLEIEAGRLEPDHLELVASMREAVARSNAIVSDLKRSIGGFLPTFEVINVTDLLQEIVQLYRPQCDAVGIVMHNAIETGLVLEGDRQLLGQLFENLLKNAVESQPDGGRLAVTAARRDGSCQLIFENDGCLLGSAEAGEIFTPYFTTKAKGTGLGLAISRKIVEAHGGRIVHLADRQPGVFRLLVELPARQEHEGERNYDVVIGVKGNADTDRR